MRQSHPLELALLSALAVFFLFPLNADAQLETSWRGYLQGDLRLVVDDADVPLERLESTFYGRMTARYGRHVRGTADLRFVFTERPEAQDFAALTNRQMLDPYRFESDALFVELKDLGLDGLDLRMGRQQLIWGTADRFHPTSNFNPLDVEDALEFGATVANELVLLSYRPYVFAGDEEEPWFAELGLELVMAPVFKPAQLPQSAAGAFTDPNEQLRLTTAQGLRALVIKEIEYLARGATIESNVDVVVPEVEGANFMYGARLAWKLLGIDMGVSYFRGFDDFPRAENVIVTGDTSDVHADVTLTYPRVHVLGAEMATSLDFLGGLGLWAEVGITFHDDLFVVVDGTRFAGNQKGLLFTNGPELEHEAGQFVKATVGMDYTPLPWWYINVQYLHGFVDEFGADKLQDYLVAGMDFKLARDKLLLRFFTILNFQDQSFVLFPQIVLTPFSGGELSVGAFLYSGLFGLSRDTKFGTPIAGASTVFTKARFSF